MILVTRDPLKAESVTATVLKESNGGVVTFMGVTRGETNGRKVLGLEYEIYPDMAEKMLQRISDEVFQHWGIADVSITHRFGFLKPGDISMVVSVASPHRKSAFEACQYVVDRIKQDVPIWKKEVFEDGSVWIGSE